MSDLQALSISDAESVYDAVLEMVKQFGGYPPDFSANADTVRWNDIPAEQGIGLFPMQGAVYQKQYVSGSYVALFPFQIQYKSAPTTPKDNIDMTEMLESLGKWLESNVSATFSDENLELNKIARTSPILLAAKDDTTATYAVNMQLNYSYKKG